MFRIVVIVRWARLGRLLGPQRPLSLRAMSLWARIGHCGVEYSLLFWPSFLRKILSYCKYGSFLVIAGNPGVGDDGEGREPKNDKAFSRD